MRNILYMLFLFIIGFSAQAQVQKDKNAKREIAVKGNCEMCKKRIEKAAYSVPGVKSAIWNSESQQLNVILNEQKSTANEIEKAVAKVGHDTENVKSSNEDYANLHACCAYERN